MTLGIIYGSFQLEIMTVLTDAGCYMGPTLLVTACTPVARNARHAVLARTLSCHLVAGLAWRSYRVAIARWNKKDEKLKLKIYYSTKERLNIKNRYSMKYRKFKAFQALLSTALPIFCLTTNIQHHLKKHFKDKIFDILCFKIYQFLE